MRIEGKGKKFLRDESISLEDLEVRERHRTLVNLHCKLKFLKIHGPLREMQMLGGKADWAGAKSLSSKPVGLIWLSDAK